MQDLDHPKAAPKDLPFWLRPISRRNLLGLGAASLASGSTGAGYMFRWEPHNLEVNRVPIQLWPSDQDAARPPIRAVHLSDLHASGSVSLDYLGRAIDLAIAQKPDLFLLTGDFITAKYQAMGELAALLSRLPAAAPTYAILGNHDGGTWAGSTYGYDSIAPIQTALQKAGVQLLHNEVRRISVGGRPLILVGLGDFWTGDFLPMHAFHQLAKAEWAPQPGEARPPILLMSHNPDSKSDLRGYPWDLMLCGHTHGGQLVVPFLGMRPFLPIRDTRFAEGLHHWEGRQIYITRGVGNLHGARFNCPPEISVLELS